MTDDPYLSTFVPYRMNEHEILRTNIPIRSRRLSANLPATPFVLNIAPYNLNPDLQSKTAPPAIKIGINVLQFLTLVVYCFAWPRATL